MSSDPERDFQENWAYNYYVTDSRVIQISGDIGENSPGASLLYFGIARSDSVFDGGNLNVLSDYRLKCKILSTLSEELIPQMLIGELTPEGESGAGITLVRNPDEDEMNCDPDILFRYYGYQTEDLITPFDLWGYWEHEWNQMARQLTCYFDAQENDLDVPAYIDVYVLSNLNLDRLNDQTQCFIPVSGETMNFEFRFSEDLGLDHNSYIGFIVRDAALNWICNAQYVYGQAHEDPGGNEWGIPDPPQMYTIPMSWDGRNNQDPQQSGHLADPDAGPYQAYVLITDDLGQIMSNIEGFNVVPEIDSILVTHTPSYPPPKTGENVAIYSVIRGKIDDSGDPTVDFRYYKPQGEPEENLNVWAGEYDNGNYRFWDLVPSRPQDYKFHRKYYENNDAETISLIDWDATKFGDLQYKWKIIHDWRIGTTNQVSYDDVIDTTSYWGSQWRADISAPTNWSNPNVSPYMRFLIISEITDTKNGYYVQQNVSTGGKDAHKVMFGADTGQPGLDMVDWAISHIGVPYALGDYTDKLPYEKIECSSFVTANRIQEIGPENNTKYAVAFITTDEYLQGYYFYDTRQIFITEQVNPCTEPDIGDGRGYLLHIQLRNPDPNSPKHIMILANLVYDCEEHRPIEITVAHARGGEAPVNGRVKFENVVTDYRVQEWIHSYLKFLLY